MSVLTLRYILSLENGQVNKYNKTIRNCEQKKSEHFCKNVRIFE